MVVHCQTFGKGSISAHIHFSLEFSIYYCRGDNNTFSVYLGNLISSLEEIFFARYILVVNLSHLIMTTKSNSILHYLNTGAKHIVKCYLVKNYN